MTPFMQAYYALGQSDEYKSVWKQPTTAKEPVYAGSGIRFIPRFKEGIMLLYRFSPGSVELQFRGGVVEEIADWLQSLSYAGLHIHHQITDDYTAIVVPAPEIDINASFLSQEGRVRIAFGLAVRLAALVNTDRDQAELLMH